jgi:hypothetical protein
MAANDTEDAAVGPVAHGDAGQEGHGRSDSVAQKVCDHRSGQGCDAGHRQGLEPIEDTGVHILAQLHPGGHARGQAGHREDAGDHDRQVVGDVATDGSAEDEAEHRGEEDRLDEDVGELLGLTPHMLERS